MSEKREIRGHAHHPGQRPHRAPPAGFLPLRLFIESQQLELEVICPEATVGRHSDVDVRLAFADISRHHCRFVFEKGVWRVYDLHSLNGVYVNNVRAFEASLYAGDCVRLGAIMLLVLSATPVPVVASDKLRQIIDILPSDYRQ